MLFFYIFLAFILSFSETKNIPVDVDVTATDQLKNKILIEDEETVITHINSDIQSLELLNLKIRQLRQNLNEHSDKHVVNAVDISEADTELREHENNVLEAIQNLKSLREEIFLLNRNQTAKTTEEINEVVAKTGEVLKNISTKLDKLDLEEDVWNIFEESKIIEKEFSSEVRSNLKLTMSNKGTLSYPSMNKKGLRVSLKNAGIILKKIKQEKKVRDMAKYQAKGNLTNNRQNKTPKYGNVTFDEAQLAEATNERHLDFVLIGFFVVLIISLISIFTLCVMKKETVQSPDNKYIREPRIRWSSWTGNVHQKLK